ncbi:MAG: hypothetical protein GY856_12260, partial [bacterium]|nr:hypothetical protein [bacterium]
TIEQFTMKRVGAAAERLARPGSAPDDGVAGRLAEIGISPAEGPEAWRRILAHHRGPQIVVAPVDFAALMAEQEAGPSPGAPAPPVGERHERPRLATAYTAPRNPVEKRLAEIWQELLGIERIGIYDDFIELGGHSLLAVQMVSQLHEKLGVKVSLPAVFEAQTVAELAEVIGAAEPQPEENVPAIVPVPRDAVPLSFAQERLWFLAELEPESGAYNLPQAFRLEGPLEVTALRRSLDEIVRRHEALRTVFVQGESGPQQVISPVQPAAFSLVDCRAGGEREAWGLLRREAARPFDLKRDPMLRAVLLRLADAPDRGHCHLLLVVMHHIAADFWS